MQDSGTRGWDVRRIGVFLFAVLHLAASAVLPAAGGVLDVERYGTPTHMESEGRDDCAPHHDHAFCQVVRTTAFGSPSRPADEVRLRPSAGVVEIVPAAESSAPAGELLRGSSGPRAPPLA